MAGRRERGGVIVESSQLGDHVSHSTGKNSGPRDSNKSKYWNKRQPSSPRGGTVGSYCNSPPRKTRKDYSNGKRFPNHRPPIFQERDFNEMAYLEKELVSRDRKKSAPISLNHLLNFTITPRERNTSAFGSGDYVSSHRRVKKSSFYNKEQFLQANCQFVVKEGGDYTVHSTDPDLLVEWNNIEQVRLLCHDIPSCPICLYTPTAAKMTRCGHVFCSSCILHYLTLGDKKWRKCPICYESIYKRDLKSVTTLASKTYAIGNKITMKLMMRKKDTTIVLPKADWTDSSVCLLPFDDEEHCRFSKLISASESQIRANIIQPEKMCLQKQLASLTQDEESERCFIEAALEDLKVREEEIQQVERSKQEASLVIRGVLPPTVSPEKQQIVNDSNETKPRGVELTKHSKDALSDEEEVEIEDLVNNGEVDIQRDKITPKNRVMRRPNTNSTSSSEGEDAESTSTGSETSSPQVTEFVFFYQATDGQHLYIHPINSRCLVKEYGSWEKCPDIITAHIVEMEQYSMTEDERSRHKYLNHLPLTCEFVLCELDLVPPLVSPHILVTFADQLDKRRQKRQRKKREEKRRERKAERKDTDPVYFPSNVVDITPEHFHDFLSLASSPLLPSPMSKSLNPGARVFTPSKDNDKGRDTVQHSLQDQEPVRISTSFAQALARGEKKWSPNPKPVITTSVGVVTNTTDPESLGNEEDNFVPSFQNSFSDALLSASNSVHVTSQNNGGKPCGSKAAKKGRKKMVLFSTGGTRRI